MWNQIDQIKRTLDMTTMWKMHQVQYCHTQRALGRILMILTLTLLVLVSPTQEEAQEEAVRDSPRDIAINDPSQDEIREMFEPKSRRKRFIYPGTKWCGDGDIANDYSDLGRRKDMDMCCRDHDNCKDNIPANGTKHGLYNNRTHTSSHCDCDASFSKCLYKLKGFDSGLVGGLYFQSAVCFNYSYPAHCATRDPRSKRCLEYAYDTRQKRQWQFFDVEPWSAYNRHNIELKDKRVRVQTVTQDDKIINRARVNKFREYDNSVYFLDIKDLNEDQVKDIFVPKSRRKRLIYPGTKWCGDGDTAKDYSDLGRLKDLDMCCRDHDNCKDNIPANGTKHGLHNNLTHTSSHCDCDTAFRGCLEKVKSFDTRFVGGLYFTLAVCFQYSHPAHCVERAESGDRCVKYKYDKTAAKTWQFFDTLPWHYVKPITGASMTSKYAEPTTVTSTPVQYTTATDEPPQHPLTSRAASITVGSTVTAITVAAVVTLVIYNKMKDGNTCCPCKKSTKYKMVSTEEDFV